MTLKQTKYLTLFAGCGALLLLLYGFNQNPLMIKQLGLFGPFVFMIVQIIQVVIPIIPGPVACGLGVMLFGPWFGFIFNYIGSVLGAIIAFLLAKHYGEPFVLKYTSPTIYKKYLATNKFYWFFGFALIVPGFPDDLLCMIAGVTPLSFKNYLQILLPCKAISLFCFSFGLDYLSDLLYVLI